MYAKGKGIQLKKKNVKNAKGTKKVIFEYRHDLKDELDCDKGYVHDVKGNDRKVNKNQCTDDDTSYKDDDTSYKDVGSCKDDDTSYRDDGSCKDNSSSCWNVIMKSPMWPREQRTKTDDNDGNRSLIDNSDDIVEVINLCNSDDSENDDEQ